MILIEIIVSLSVLLGVVTGVTVDRALFWPDEDERSIVVTDTACQWVGYITVSGEDTTETIRQVIAHNSAVKKNCKEE